LVFVMRVDIQIVVSKKLLLNAVWNVHLVFIVLPVRSHQFFVLLVVMVTVHQFRFSALISALLVLSVPLVAVHLLRFYFRLVVIHLLMVWIHLKRLPYVLLATFVQLVLLTIVMLCVRERNFVPQVQSTQFHSIPVSNATSM